MIWRAALYRESSVAPIFDGIVTGFLRGNLHVVECWDCPSDVARVLIFEPWQARILLPKVLPDQGCAILQKFSAAQDRMQDVGIGALKCSQHQLC